MENIDQLGNEETAPDSGRQLAKTSARINAEASHSSLFTNASTSRAFSLPKFGELDVVEVAVVLREKTKQVQAGDLSEVEAILIGQATTLDTIFNTLAMRAAANLGQLAATDTYLRNAFKAQAQCRTTLQTLAEIKNPRPVAFVKQANIAHGPQQVNNDVPARPASPARAREEKPIQSNELLGVQHGQRLDAGAASAAGGIDPHLETVATIDRPTD